MSTSSSENELEKTSPFFLIGNHPALDLANTLVTTKDGPLDLLPDLLSVCRWLEEAKLAGDLQIKIVQRSWSSEGANQFLGNLKDYRNCIKEAVSELGLHGKIPARFIEETNRMLRDANAILQINSASENKCSRGWSVSWQKPESVMGLIAETGLHLVCDCEWGLIRKCENPQCVLTFYDTTKSHQRRWCIMEVCGNRHKAALHRKKILTRKDQRV